MELEELKFDNILNEDQIENLFEQDEDIQETPPEQQETKETNNKESNKENNQEINQEPHINNEEATEVDAENLFDEPEGVSSKEKEKEDTIPAFARLSDDVITLAVFKKAEKSDDSVIRLFNPTAEARKTVLTLPAIGFEKEFTLGAYEFKTVKINLATKTVVETDLTER